MKFLVHTCVCYHNLHVFLILIKLQVVVFSKSYCPYCKQTQKLLKGKNLKADALVWIEMENRPDCDEMQNYLKQLTGARSVSVNSYSIELIGIFYLNYR